MLPCKLLRFKLLVVTVDVVDVTVAVEIKATWRLLACSILLRDLACFSLFPFFAPSIDSDVEHRNIIAFIAAPSTLQNSATASEVDNILAYVIGMIECRLAPSPGMQCFF